MVLEWAMKFKKERKKNVRFLYLDQHINSLNAVVRVQLAQRRIRKNDNFRGGFNNRGQC